jgi:uncharacterized membrane protein (Fun14 family)
VVDYAALAVSLLTTAGIGYVSGWAFKRLLGVIETFLAIVFLMFGGAAALGIITVNPGRLLYWIGWASEKIWGLVDGNTILATAGSWLMAFTAGFILGLAKGAPASALSGRLAEASEWLEG